ncbi:MAG: class I SAM-dependent methyltransferase [Candidatus Omnitrophota bacterium]
MPDELPFCTFDDYRKKVLDREALFLEEGYDFALERARILDQVSPLPRRILEAGTGKGHFTLALAERGLSFTTFDITAEDQAVAKFHLRHHGLAAQVVFRIEHETRLSFPDESFDILFCINALHHLTQPRATLAEWLRILAPQGRMVLSDFSAEGFAIVERIHALEGRAHPREEFTIPLAMHFLQEKGLKVARTGSRLQETLIAEKPL